MCMIYNIIIKNKGEKEEVLSACNVKINFFIIARPLQPVVTPWRKHFAENYLSAPQAGQIVTGSKIINSNCF